MGATSSLVSTTANHALKEGRTNVLDPELKLILSSVPKKSSQHGNHSPLFIIHEGYSASQWFSTLDAR